MDTSDQLDDLLDRFQPMTLAEQYEMLLGFFALQIRDVDRATLLAAQADILKLPDTQVRQFLVDAISGQLARQEKQDLGGADAGT